MTWVNPYLIIPVSCWIWDFLSHSQHISYKPVPFLWIPVTWGFPVGLSHLPSKPMYRIRFNQLGFLHPPLGQEYGLFSGVLIGDLSSHWILPTHYRSCLTVEMFSIFRSFHLWLSVSYLPQFYLKITIKLVLRFLSRNILLF